MHNYIAYVLVIVGVSCYEEEDVTSIDVVDMTHPTTTAVIAEHYGAVERQWKICTNCGIPGLGTAMHLEHEVASTSAMYPAVIPTEYLVTKLAIIDVSAMVRLDPTLVLTLEVALQWPVLRQDPREPTLLLFKFGWKSDQLKRMRSCVCKIPGLSYELAEWIAANLTHVVGVATDAPTLESEQTREFDSRTVANILGKSGIYMLENVNVRTKMPERGCMTIAMPMKLLHTSYVPSRLTAFCPAGQTGHQVVLALQSFSASHKLLASRNRDVNMDDIMK